MKNFLKASASTAILVAFLATSAHAADLGGSYKDPAGPDASFDSPRVVNWTGFYIGGSVGYGNANHDLTLERYNGGYCYDQKDPNGDQVKKYAPTDPTDPFAPFHGDNDKAHIDSIPESGSCDDQAGLGPKTGVGAGGVSVPHQDLKTVNNPNANGEADHSQVAPSTRELANLDGLNSHGVVGDIRLGADLQRGRFVFGVFGSYGFNGMETDGSITDLGSFNIEKGDEWSIGARAGVLVNPRTLVYALAAYTETEYDFSISGGDETESKTVDFSGVTVGGGVEFALTQSVFLGIEGTHTFYGKETLLDIKDDSAAGEIGGFGTRLTDEIGETKVMGTLKIKLNSGLPNFTD